MADAIQIDVESWRVEARAALVSNDFATVEKFCRLIINSDPRHADAHFCLAAIAIETRQYGPAVKLLRLAITYDPSQSEYFALLARAYAALHEDSFALQAADKTAAMPAVDALSLDTVGCVYSQAGLHDKAAEQFARAVTLSPDTAEFHYNLAVSSRFLGDFDLAEKSYEKAISLDPAFAKAHWSLANLRTQSLERNHIDRLSGLLKKLSGAESKADIDAMVFLHCGLAKEFEDLGEYDESFSHLQAGKTIARKTMDYSPDDDRRLFAELERVFRPGALDNWPPGFASEEPIFIVGMPRTGTTLVERILTNHSEVYSAGELSVFGQQLRLLTGSLSPTVLDEDVLRAGANVDPCTLGEAYLNGTRPYTGHTARFVDKMPLNFLYIGYIRQALPNARIVCVRRNPMDTCLSNFRALFAREKATYYRYSYDILETGQYYLMFDRLLSHWQNELPNAFLEVNYEDVVSNQEVESRRLLDYCGLQWEDSCLNFEQNTAPVTTASSAQVRQPIYSSAVQRWKHYADHLQRLRELLETNGVTVE